MPVIDADGCPIHVEVDGVEGRPVLMLSNSLGTALGMWDAQMPAFSRSFRVVRYDSRGHGKSGAPQGPYSIARLAKDALCVMDALGLERVHWCGLSKGGLVGQYLAIHAPARIGKLVLANTAAQIPPVQLWNDRIMTVRSAGMAAITDGIMVRWFTPGFRERGGDALARVREMVLTTPAHGYAGCCAAIRDADQREAVARIGAPTLVIAGRHDPATTLAQGEFLAGRIRGAKLAVMEAAHLSNVETPDSFTAACTQFLG